MNKVISLYEHLKNTPGKLKIVCDWDEVIQAHEPYVWYLGVKEKIKQELEGKEVIFPPFSEIFEDFWNGKAEKCEIEYSPYGSKMRYKHWTRGDADKDGELTMWNYTDDISVSYSNIKNSPNFYQQAPFLTIAEDLLKLIKEDKVERLVFLSAYDKRKFPNGDPRKREIFRTTFAQYVFDLKEKHNINLYTSKIHEFFSLESIPFDSKTQQGASKADWIKENASDFDIVIDDNPNICRSVFELNLCEECKDYCDVPCSECPSKQIEVITPYYPVIENQHHESVLLVKNEVSDLKREDFVK